MGRELLAQNVERSLYIFRPFVDDVEVRVGLNQTAWRSAHCGAHVCNIESAVWLRADLICNG